MTTTTTETATRHEANPGCRGLPKMGARRCAGDGGRAGWGADGALSAAAGDEEHRRCPPPNGSSNGRPPRFHLLRRSAAPPPAPGVVNGASHLSRTRPATSGTRPETHLLPLTPSSELGGAAPQLPSEPGSSPSLTSAAPARQEPPGASRRLHTPSSSGGARPPVMSPGPRPAARPGPLRPPAAAGPACSAPRQAVGCARRRRPAPGTGSAVTASLPSPCRRG